MFLKVKQKDLQRGIKNQQKYILQQKNVVAQKNLPYISVYVTKKTSKLYNFAIVSRIEVCF